MLYIPYELAPYCLLLYATCTKLRHCLQRPKFFWKTSQKCECIGARS